MYNNKQHQQKKMTMTKLYIKLREGFEKMGYDSTLIAETWKYCGGDKGPHLKYFEENFNFAQPPHKSHCICEVEIKYNCYITDPEETEILVIGNCCIKRFMKHSGRTCKVCKSPHKNRKDNLCNICRLIKFCKKPNCYIPAVKYIDYCYQCTKNNPNCCKKCDKPCGKYRFCYPCNPNFANQPKKINNCLKCDIACGSYIYCYPCNPKFAHLCGTNNNDKF